MVKWVKDNKGLTSLLSIVVSMPLFWGIYSAGKSFKKEFDSYISSRVQDEIKNSPGRLEKKIARGLEMGLPETSTYLIGIIRDHKNREEVNYFWLDVNGDLMYTYEDGKDYRPIWYASTNRYYLKFPDDSWIYCQ